MLPYFQTYDLSSTWTLYKFGQFEWSWMNAEPGDERGFLTFGLKNRILGAASGETSQLHPLTTFSSNPIY